MTEITQHLSQDTQLASIIPLIQLPALQTNQNPYLALIESIVSQQLSVKVADIIFNRFIQLFDTQYPKPEEIVAMDLETMRSVGLSKQKAAYIQNVAQFELDNGMALDKLNTLTDEETIAYLSQIKGVGKWTVEMLLIFTLQRPDVFPLDDLGIQQGMAALYQLEEKGKELKKRMTEIAESWKPYRSTACRYVWRWKDVFVKITN